jgi:hypothetical protein
MRKGPGRWRLGAQRGRPLELELGAKLRKVQRKNKALEAQVKQLKEQLELSREEPPPRPPTPPPRPPGPLWTSPATGDAPRPRYSGFHLDPEWASITGTRGRSGRENARGGRGDRSCRHHKPPQTVLRM